MPDQHTNFDYPTIIALLSYELGHISVIGNVHCACAVSRDLSPGEEATWSTFLKYMTQIYLFTFCHFLYDED